MRKTLPRKWRTRATIDKINNVIMAKYESYRTRRLPISIPANTNPINGATYRVDALRDLMRLEMPDSFSDVTDAPITKTVYNGTTVIARPAANQAYLTVLNAAKAKNSSAYGSTNLQQAMCLYLIVTKDSDDPDILEQFSPSEIQTDSDTGLSYFVDGWGNAIFYLRWAPGFHSASAMGSVSEHAKLPTVPEPYDPFDPARGLPSNICVHQ